VVLARDGREGLELIGALGPAAVILDIRLPGLDGWEVLGRLREDASTRAIPVIVVSILDERSRGLSLGAADYLIKPVGREELVGALGRVGVAPSTATPAGEGPPPPVPSRGAS
jgi:DNA-binding response OmpR family regulator